MKEQRRFSRVLIVVLMFVCCLNVMPLSSVTPRNFMVSVTGRGVFRRVMCGWALYSMLCGVISVSEDLLADTFSLFVVSQTSSAWM